MVVSIQEVFAAEVLALEKMAQSLPPDVCSEYADATLGRGTISPKSADDIAEAMRLWAQERGATHYCHWFQPWTGSSAEKHDSFLSLSADGNVIERFSGSALIQGEPDASSLPSGGLRNTYEARGYTCWDPSSPPFLWRSQQACVLCIPSVFFSYNGEALDTKIPLLRSEARISEAVRRLMRLLGEGEEDIFSTLGCEQEYFLLDKARAMRRKDIAVFGTTVLGASPAKGQELEDHYFGALKGRVIAFMHDLESEAIALGIPVKTRHNEVAPAQHELAPLFERASLAVDHNILLMQLAKRVADAHGLLCLFHEKPFAAINGSGKHLNWSLSTASGINLLDPSQSPRENTRFLLLLAAVLCGVHTHADILRASIGSQSNDKRLGGNEAPPCIISVFLGHTLDALLSEIEEQIPNTGSKRKALALGLPMIPPLSQHDTDRNRTSPFAFTGNKFEFRACGSSQSPAFPITVLNTIVAAALNTMCAAIETGETVEKVLVDTLKRCRSIRFLGDNYGQAWREEAARRGLPAIASSKEAFDALLTERAIELFEGVLSPAELHSIHGVLVEGFEKRESIERKLLIDMVETGVLPAAFAYQQVLSTSIAGAEEVGGESLPIQKRMLRRYISLVSKALERLDEVKGSAATPTEELRKAVDALEEVTDEKLWPMPKYGELLFHI